MLTDLNITKYKLSAEKVIPIQISGGGKASCETEHLEATAIPTWFSAIPDVGLPPARRDASRVLLARLQQLSSAPFVITSHRIAQGIVT